ncbi:SH2 domain-containing adapter protein E isoform X2 [Nothobranchius furzeri]|uniref:Transcript variant X2 n=1 Tax=Nothobranchius furzeri TaxID=105023 RepID=A0A9D2XYW9_NOTFU|nr:transcript variant X2 [Nothobranchius furzeri]
MELKGVRPSKEIYWFIWDKMPKWFKEFPIALKHDTDKICSASESDSQPNGSKTGQRKNSSVDGTGGSGGAGSLLSGKNQKNSGRMSVISQKDKKVWDSLLKSYKNSRTESTFEEQHRPLKASSSACSYISMIRVDKQDKKPNFNNGTMTVLVPEAEKTTPCKTEIMRILEDYADPFDAPRTREQRDVERLGENDGYMEPYDAQQMITEIRRRGSKDLLKGSALTDRSRGTFEKGHSGSIRIYDLPYEGGGDNKRTEVTRPELDRRPATEYELPWEQSKEHIVRTLSAQFDNPVRDETLQEHLKQKSRTQNILRSSPALLPYLSNPESEICCINPSLPLEKQRKQSFSCSPAERPASWSGTVSQTTTSTPLPSKPLRVVFTPSSPKQKRTASFWTRAAVCFPASHRWCTTAAPSVCLSPEPSTRLCCTRCLVVSTDLKKKRWFE